VSKKILDLFYGEDSEKYSDNIDFSFSQAEKSLKSSIEISDTIDDKAYKLIGFFITSFIITIGVFFTVLFGMELAIHRFSIIIALFIFAVGLWLAIQKTRKTFDIEDYIFLVIYHRSY
jgi:divalent metal cation (Fe/Co/Zn/Cd) transporter